MVRTLAGPPAVAAVTAGLVSVCLLLSGCAGHTRAVGAPVPAMAPTRAPGTVTVSGSCTVRGAVTAVDSGVHGLVLVDRLPTRVALVWVPGLDTRPCAAVLSHAGQRVARQLAAAVDTAPPVPDGMGVGVAGDGMEVRLYFDYPGRTAEQVTVGLGGAGHVGAPGRDLRELTDALAAVLRPLAPPAWRPRLNRG